METVCPGRLKSGDISGLSILFLLLEGFLILPGIFFWMQNVPVAQIGNAILRNPICFTVAITLTGG